MDIISLTTYCKNSDIETKQNKLHHCAKQIFKCIEKYHSLGYIHKSLTPDSFQINSQTGELLLHNDGTMTPFSYEYTKIKEKYKTMYKINFSMVDYHDFEYESIYELSKNKYIHSGTMKYVSHKIHDGYDYSPRDDLISLCYILLELKYGVLPWSHLVCNNDTQINILYRNIKKYVSMKQYYLSLVNDFNSIFQNINVHECPFITMYYNLIYRGAYDMIDYHYIYSLIDI